MRATICGCVVAATWSVTYGQELSNDVFPSEDELIQAYESGEISFEQLLVLTELATLGVDSTSMYQLDEIPNLSFITEDTVAGFSLEHEQASGFTSHNPAHRSRVTVNYTQRPDAEPDSEERYRFRGRIQVNERWLADMSIHREFSGRERWVHRSLQYSSRDGAVRRAVFGNFTTRLGLGTVFGYRGKLLSFDDDLSTESLLFPDYGGYNGVLINAETGRQSVTGLASFNRDESFSLTSLGGSVERKFGRSRGGFVAGLNFIRNREIDMTALDIKAALTSHINFSQGYVSSEATLQTGDSPSAGALVVEGLTRLENAAFRFAGWYYSNQFADISSGSKSMTISSSFTISDIRFTRSSRRTGQRGILLRTSVTPFHRFELNNSVIYGTLNGVRERIQISSELVYTHFKTTAVGIRYLGDSRPFDEEKHQYRFFFRWERPSMSGRAYVQLEDRRIDESTVSLFSSVRIDINSQHRLHLWSHLSRLGTGEPSRWYTYAKLEQQMSENISLSVKLSNRHDVTNSNENDPLVSFELTGSW